jgi:hypothetical protein
MNSFEYWTSTSPVFFIRIVRRQIQSTSEYQNPKSGLIDKPDTFGFWYSNSSVFKYILVGFKAIKWSEPDGKSNGPLKTGPEIEWQLKNQTIFPVFNELQDGSQKWSGIRMAGSS